MADQQDDVEKELPASEQKIRKAREEGQVPRSRELSGGVVMLVASLMLYALGEQLAGQARFLLTQALTLSRNEMFDSAFLSIRLTRLLLDSLWILLPLFAAVIVSALLSTTAVGGFNWSSKSLEPKLSKLNPIQGFKNMFSVTTLMELFKAIVKSFLLVGAGMWLLYLDFAELVRLSAMPIEKSILIVSDKIVWYTLTLSLVFFVVVLIDVPFQYWRYFKGLRMNLQELKKELKESEGDPYLKARIRSIQREMARSRMMQAVPTADVIVTNPTHFSVALSYKQGSSAAPKVVAKGRGEVALKIRELARAHQVPIVEVPALARALHQHGELEREIPAALFAVVAKLLAYLYALSDGIYTADFPSDSDVPEGMDPGVPPEAENSDLESSLTQGARA